MEAFAAFVADMAKPAAPKDKRGTVYTPGFGHKPGQQGKRTASDAEVIAMRTMHQVDRKPMHIVMRAYPQYSQDYVRSVLLYTVRSQPHLRVGDGVAATQ
jgi:hypothetical protein